jgi:hypothetical protein
VQQYVVHICVNSPEQRALCYMYIASTYSTSTIVEVSSLHAGFTNIEMLRSSSKLACAQLQHARLCYSNDDMFGCAVLIVYATLLTMVCS